MMDKENIVAQQHSNNQQMINKHIDHAASVSVDMLDCDGERRIAMIVHNPVVRTSLRQLFSPLRPKKKTNNNSKNVQKVQNSKKLDKSAEPVTKKRSREPLTPSSMIARQDMLEEKRKKRSKKVEMTEYMTKVSKVDVGDENGHIYDSCPEVVQKIEEFLAKEGATRSIFLTTIDVHGNSLRTFLKGKNQEQRTNVCYRHAYFFFEKIRIHEGAPKTLRRLQNEAYLTSGFGLMEENKIDDSNNVVRSIEDFEFC